MAETIDFRRQKSASKIQCAQFISEWSTWSKDPDYCAVSEWSQGIYPGCFYHPPFWNYEFAKKIVSFVGLEIDVKKQMCFGRNWILSQSSLRPFPTEVRACKENPSNIWLCATIFNNEFVNILWFKNTIINYVSQNLMNSVQIIIQIILLSKTTFELFWSILKRSGFTI